MASVTPFADFRREEQLELLEGPELQNPHGPLTHFQGLGDLAMGEIRHEGEEENIAVAARQLIHGRAHHTKQILVIHLRFGTIQIIGIMEFFGHLHDILAPAVGIDHFIARNAEEPRAERDALALLIRMELLPHLHEHIGDDILRDVRRGTKRGVAVHLREEKIVDPRERFRVALLRLAHENLQFRLWKHRGNHDEREVYLKQELATSIPP